MNESDKCTASCALGANDIIGILWIQEKDVSVTIIQERYRSVIDTFHGLLHVVKICDLRVRGFNRTAQHLTWQLRRWDTWWIVWWKRYFKKSAFPWSPRSPDLSPLDFFLWGHFKDIMYHNIPRGRCERVIEKFKHRVTECISRQGGHIEHRI